MTLILTCLTDTAVYQVSDRRLTSLADPNQVVEDERNKAVILNGRASFGYTGLAELAGQRTDLWLVKTIVQDETGNIEDVIQRIRVAATEEFRKLNASAEHKRHAFHVTGWFRCGEELRPGEIIIENAMGDDGTWLRQARDEFRIARQIYADLHGSCAVNGVGQKVSAGERDAIFRLIRKCVKHRRATQRTVMEALVMSVRWLAEPARGYPRIGPNVMAVTIPWCSVAKIWRTGDISIGAGLPYSDEQITCSYFSNTVKDKYFMPHWIVGRTARIAPTIANRRLGPNEDEVFGVGGADLFRR